MTRKEIENIIRDEIKLYFRSLPKHKSIQKLTNVTQMLLEDKADEKTVGEYVEYIYSTPFKKVMDPKKRGSVDYFTAILSNVEQYVRFSEIKKAQNQIEEETGITFSDDKECMEAGAFYDGFEYRYLNSINNIDIYYNKQLDKHIVIDYSDFIPQTQTLEKFNEENQDRPIVVDKMFLGDE